MGTGTRVVSKLLAWGSVEVLVAGEELTAGWDFEGFQGFDFKGSDPLKSLTP